MAASVQPSAACGVSLNRLVVTLTPLYAGVAIDNAETVPTVGACALPVGIFCRPCVQREPLNPTLRPHPAGLCTSGPWGPQGARSCQPSFVGRYGGGRTRLEFLTDRACSTADRDKGLGNEQLDDNIEIKKKTRFWRYGGEFGPEYHNPTGVVVGGTHA